MKWYDGAPLLYHLEHVHVASDRNLVDVRFPVQWVVRPTDETESRGYAGQVAAGVLRKGDDVLVVPSGDRSRIASIEGPLGPVDEAVPPMSVAVRLEDELDISRGDMLCRPGNRPHRSRQLEAMVCWMSDTPVSVGSRLLLKHTTRWVTATVDDVRYRVDVETLHRDTAANGLQLNDIGRLKIRTSSPLPVDDYRRNRTTGSFILVDEGTNDTVGAGMIVETITNGGAPADASGRSPNVVWSEGGLTRDERWRTLGQKGATVPPRSSSTSSRAGGWPTGSTATTCATGSTATSASRPRIAPRTCGAPRMWRGCSPTRARSPSPRSSPPMRATAARRAPPTTSSSSTSSRCSWTRRSRNASGATRRACTRRPAAARSAG